MKKYLISEKFRKILKYAFVLAVGGLFLSWLIYTPAGLLGKMDAIGCAICHRIDSRSFHLGDRQLPLCARCSGMQLGILLGLAFQYSRGKKGNLPPLKIMIPLGIFLGLFGVDGINSYLHFFPGAPSLYEPQNWMRLMTGTGLGVGIAAIILPVFHQTYWTDWQDLPLLSNWKDLLGLLLLAAGLDVMILSENPLLLYPLAILSAVTVFIILTMCYSMLWVILLKKENQYATLKSAWLPLLAGFATALVQIYLVDFLRLYFTGGWGGFML